MGKSALLASQISMHSKLIELLPTVKLNRLHLRYAYILYTSIHYMKELLKQSYFVFCRSTRYYGIHILPIILLSLFSVMFILEIILTVR